MKKSVKLGLVFCMFLIVLNLLIVNVWTEVVTTCTDTRFNTICDNPVTKTECEDCEKEILEECSCSYEEPSFEETNPEDSLDLGSTSSLNIFSSFFNFIFREVQPALPAGELSKIENNFPNDITMTVYVDVEKISESPIIGAWSKKYTIIIPSHGFVNLETGKDNNGVQRFEGINIISKDRGHYRFKIKAIDENDELYYFYSKSFKVEGNNLNSDELTAGDIFSTEGDNGNKPICSEEYSCNENNQNPRTGDCESCSGEVKCEECANGYRKITIAVSKEGESVTKNILQPCDYDRCSIGNNRCPDYSVINVQEQPSMSGQPATLATLSLSKELNIFTDSLILFQGGQSGVQELAGSDSSDEEKPVHALYVYIFTRSSKVSQQKLDEFIQKIRASYASYENFDQGDYITIVSYHVIDLDRERPKNFDSVFGPFDVDSRAVPFAVAIWQRSQRNIINQGGKFPWYYYLQFWKWPTDFVIITYDGIMKEEPIEIIAPPLNSEMPTPPEEEEGEEIEIPVEIQPPEPEKKPEPVPEEPKPLPPEETKDNLSCYYKQQTIGLKKRLCSSSQLLSKYALEIKDRGL